MHRLAARCRDALAHLGDILHAVRNAIRSAIGDILDEVPENADGFTPARLRRLQRQRRTGRPHPRSP
ncbi:hypothetical protein ACWD4N_18680 [Streptomyces sp. NPDC002586]